MGSRKSGGPEKIEKTEEALSWLIDARAEFLPVESI
jgi:hypothetical protein